MLWLALWRAFNLYRQHFITYKVVKERQSTYSVPRGQGGDSAIKHGEVLILTLCGVRRWGVGEDVLHWAAQRVISWIEQAHCRDLGGDFWFQKLSGNLRVQWIRRVRLQERPANCSGRERSLACPPPHWESPFRPTFFLSTSCPRKCSPGYSGFFDCT